jgi:hypothetical protein
MSKLREIMRGLARKVSPPGNRAPEDGQRSDDPARMSRPSEGGSRSIRSGGGFGGS